MAMQTLREGEIYTIFSSLERLFVKSFDLYFRMDDITHSSFPFLRHLDIFNVITCDNMGPLLPPPSESLEIHVNEDDHTWLAMILGCNASLKSLRLLIATEDFISTAV